MMFIAKDKAIIQFLVARGGHLEFSDHAVAEKIGNSFFLPNWGLHK